MHRGGRKTLSQAVQDGVSAWSFDDETIITERAKGTRYLGAKDRDTGAIWITPISSFFDRARFKIQNYTGRGGGIVRTVEFRYFAMRRGTLKKL